MALDTILPVVKGIVQGVAGTPARVYLDMPLIENEGQCVDQACRAATSPAVVDLWVISCGPFEDRSPQDSFCITERRYPIAIDVWKSYAAGEADAATFRNLVEALASHFRQHLTLGMDGVICADPTCSDPAGEPQMFVDTYLVRHAQIRIPVTEITTDPLAGP